MRCISATCACRIAISCAHASASNRIIGPIIPCGPANSSAHPPPMFACIATSGGTPSIIARACISCSKADAMASNSSASCAPASSCISML
eukprot:680267-Hanusia_phi.AAC.1